MRRLLSVILVLAMLMTIASPSVMAASTKAAKISQTGTEYDTVSAALAAAGSGQTVVLMANCGESLTIPAGVTLSAGDYTVSGIVTNDGTIESGEFTHTDGYPADVINRGTISNGTYRGRVENTGNISSGLFKETVDNNANGVISGIAIFESGVMNDGGTISGGIFNGYVQNDCYSRVASLINGGTFKSHVENGPNGTIARGEFTYTDSGMAPVINYGIIAGGIYQGNVECMVDSEIVGGTFNDIVEFYGGTISGGTYELMVFVDATSSVIVTAGTFNSRIVYEGGALDFSGVNPDTFSVIVQSNYYSSEGSSSVPIGSDVSGRYSIKLHPEQAAYRDGAEVSNINISNHSVTTIGKRVGPTTFTVSFAANGGTGTMANATNLSGDYTLPACGFTAPAGKRFKTWSVGGSEKAVGATITVTANTTVTAVWEDIPAPTTYTVTFDANGHGTAPDAINDVADGSKITAPSAPTANGYTFGGWYKESECQNEWNFATDTVTESITLYAKWTEASQPVIYKNYHILSDDLTHIQTVLDGVANVTKDSQTGVVTIKFTEDIYGRIWIGEDNFNDMLGEFVIDLGGKTIDPGTKEEAICFDNNFEGNATITGEGVLKRGENNIIYCWHHDNVCFDVAEGKDYFSLKAGNTDLYEVKNTEAKNFSRWDVPSLAEELTLTQGNFELYTVTFDANGGTVTPANATTDANGKLTILPTPTRSGSYAFNGWYTASSGGTQITVDKVYTENTTIYAQWTYTGGGGGGGGTTRYTVKFNTDGGSKVANATVIRNRKATEPKAPEKEGYTFMGWFTDSALTEAYDFDSKVTKSITLYAKWEKVDDDNVAEDTDTHTCPSKAFDDLDVNLWYHSDTDYVLANGLMNGTGETAFAPNSNLTRAMLVTILYRNEGEPATNRSIPFADIDMGAYYASAVIWASQNGIAKGITDTEFAPDNNITREQIAAMIFRYAQYKGMDAVTLEENLHFDDSKEISEFAVSAMNWAVGQGLMKGRTAHTLNPKDHATRAEIAAILHRFIEADK